MFLPPFGQEQRRLQLGYLAKRKNRKQQKNYKNKKLSINKKHYQPGVLMGCNAGYCLPEPNLMSFMCKEQYTVTSTDSIDLSQPQKV